MGQTRDPAVVADLLKIARGSEDESLRQEAFAALGMVGAPDAVQALLDVVHGGDDAEKLAAAAALQNVRNHAAAPAIDDALSKPLPEELIGYMVTALGKCGTKENVPTLSRIARDGGETEGIRLTAVKAMGEIGDASAAPAVLEYTEQATDANSRSQSVDALSKVARPEDVTRIQKLLDASPENSRDRYILQGLVERLKKGILTPGRPR
jgi:HEAT repeat protein